MKNPPPPTTTIMYSMRRQLPFWAFLVVALVPAVNSFPADAAKALPREGFEDVKAGPLTTLDTGVGVWKASAGHAAVHNRHAYAGKQSLLILGGKDRTVELTPLPGKSASHQLTFWAERWTGNKPFAFRVDRFHNGRWREIYRGDNQIRVGGFLTHVVIGLTDKPAEKFRFVCTAPKDTGIMIDDVELIPARQMEVVGVTTIQAVVPVLVGREMSPVARVCVDTVGNLDPISLTKIGISTSGTTSLDDVESVAVFCSGNDKQLTNTTTDRIDPDGLLTREMRMGEPQPPAAKLVFHGKKQLLHGANYFWICFKLKTTANIDHRVDAGCSHVEFSDRREKIVPDVGNPSGSLRIGLALRNAGDDRSRCYRIPGLATTNKGTLIAVYDVRWRGFGDLPGDIDVGMSRSTDGGRTWEPMKIVMDLGNSPKWNYDGVGDPSVLVDQATGTIWVTGLWSHGNRGWNGSGPGMAPDETGQLVMVKSDDDGVTWSRPINVTAQIKKPEWSLLLQGPGKGITMRDGTIVLPAQYQDSPKNKRTPHSTIIYSKDHGKTWQIGTGAYRDTTEAQVVEVEPGVLMLNCRYNRQDRRVVMVTRDMGRTWTEHATSRSALPEPGACMASLINADQETEQDLGSWLLFSNPDADSSPRRRISIKASNDKGMTWPTERHLLLDEGVSAGYSCMTMIDAKTVGILYECSQSHLAFQRIPLKEVIEPASRAGADGSSASRGLPQRAVPRKTSSPTPAARPNRSESLALFVLTQKVP